MIHSNNKANYIYILKYDYHHKELCRLEGRQLFGTEIDGNQVFTHNKVNPSTSPFIKFRLDLSLFSNSFEGLITKLRAENIQIDNFKAEYTVLKGDSTPYEERKLKLKEVGFSITGEPNFQHPKITYTIGQFKEKWFFGVITKHDPSWQIHKHKPHSFSNSLDMHLAKTLVNIASKGNKKQRLLDACCGVGTVVLEACVAGFNIDGCDVNHSAYLHTVANLKHYGYQANIYHKDIGDLTSTYHAIIIDLPYDLYARSTEEIVLHIILSCSRLSNRLVIVSIKNIEPLINEAKLRIVDKCSVEKPGKGKFKRTVWVCEKAQ